VSYANVDGWEKSQESESNNVLDKWILSLLNRLVSDVTNDLDSFDTASAIAKLGLFIDEFSTWYIRRSRDRVGASAEDENDKNDFYNTTYTVLTTVCKLMAPISPFTVEEIYKNLTGEDSVHLAAWPETSKALINEDLMVQMEIARTVVERAHSIRKEKGIKVRQPLAKLTAKVSQLLDQSILDLIADEVNVKSVEQSNGKLSVELDTNITKELEDEAQARDLVRKIQEERKSLGTSLDEKVNVTLPGWPEDFEHEIKRKALIENLTVGEFKVSKI
jgi:isoleucyl-tRNA synthetase